MRHGVLTNLLEESTRFSFGQSVHERLPRVARCCQLFAFALLPSTSTIIYYICLMAKLRRALRYSLVLRYSISGRRCRGKRGAVAGTRKSERSHTFNSVAPMYCRHHDRYATSSAKATRSAACRRHRVHWPCTARRRSMLLLLQGDEEEIP